MIGNTKQMILNVIQEAPTPHNNTLLKECKKIPGLELVLWYYMFSFKGHGFTDELAYEVSEPHSYKRYSIDWPLLKRFLFRKENFLMVGWTSPTARLIVLASFLLRKPLNMWFDMPNDSVKRNYFKASFRNFFYFLIKYAPVKIFCVGNATVEYFAKRGFSRKRLVNLPIFIDITHDKQFYLASSSALQEEMKIGKTDFIVSAGSRLLYEKGYDLLIDAIQLLPIQIKAQIKVFIIGKGEEENRLTALIKNYHLQESVRLVPWLPTESFMSLIALSSVFIHPARFDAFGGTIFAMSVGTPVIGSKTAGAAFDRIEESKNGFLYEAEDIQKLADHISWCYEQRNNELITMGLNARATALQWAPAEGARIILKNCI